MIMQFMRSNRTFTEKSVWRLARWLLLPLIPVMAGNAFAGEKHKFIPGETRTGAYIFQNYCVVCHGEKGDGQSRAKNGLNPPPRNFTSPESAAELTRERMIHSVTNGRPGTAMIGWGQELSKAEIEGVVDHIRSTFMRLEKAKTSAPKRPDSKLLESRGGVLYMQACAMCHGESGARATSGNMQPPPRDFTAPQAAAELSRKRMIASVTNGRPGTAMRGYSSQYSKGDIEAIVDFIRAAFMTGSAPK